MFSFIKAMNVISGTFPIFRREVFDKLGLYVGGHKTEDQELTLRMQANHMEIEHAYNAYVFTGGMKNISSLYKQRKRWIYGFIKNTLDYKKLIFNSKYGNIGFISLPIGFFAIFFSIFLIIYIIYNFCKYIYRQYLIFSAIGFLSSLKLDFIRNIFFVNTSMLLFMTILFYGMFLISIFISAKMYDGKTRFNINIIYYFLVYPLIAPFWMIGALYDIVRNTSPNWTQEIESRSR
jgi:cellulose synthase/poly-beta-1,6-N-acetylglucosamine synthase-like glycosyltransferase